MHDQVKTGRVPQVSLLRPGTTPGALHLEEMWEGSGIMIGRVPYISKRCGREAA